MKSELDSLKTQQKDLIVELSTFKDKVNIEKIGS